MKTLPWRRIMCPVQEWRICFISVRHLQMENKNKISETDSTVQSVKESSLLPDLSLTCQYLSLKTANRVGFKAPIGCRNAAVRNTSVQVLCNEWTASYEPWIDL